MPKPMPEFVSHVLDSMRRTAPVSAKSMFGGWGVYADSIMVGLIAEDVLYFKVDSSSQPEFEAVGSTPFTYHGGGKTVQMSYWRVPDSALDAPHEMADWLRLGMAAARRAAAGKEQAKKAQKTDKAPAQRLRHRKRLQRRRPGWRKSAGQSNADGNVHRSAGK
jgi:DNA transformation protein and related proteins